MMAEDKICQGSFSWSQHDANDSFRAQHAHDHVALGGHVQVTDPSDDADDESDAWCEPDVSVCMPALAGRADEVRSDAENASIAPQRSMTTRA